MTMYCPTGDGAFEDWVKRCPECGRKLVSTPPDPDAMHDDPGEIVWLVNAPNEPEAMMWAATLRGEGIAVMLRSGGPGAGAWASSATFEHGIYVRERDHDRALRLVRSLLTGGGMVTRAPARRLAPPHVNRTRRRPR